MKSMDFFVGCNADLYRGGWLLNIFVKCHAYKWLCWHMGSEMKKIMHFDFRKILEGSPSRRKVSINKVTSILADESVNSCCLLSARFVKSRNL